jgi:hypothetical protein
MGEASLTLLFFLGGGDRIRYECIQSAGSFFLPPLLPCLRPGIGRPSAFLLLLAHEYGRKPREESVDKSGGVGEPFPDDTLKSLLPDAKDALCEVVYVKIHLQQKRCFLFYEGFPQSEGQIHRDMRSVWASKHIAE